MQNLKTVLITQNNLLFIPKPLHIILSKYPNIDYVITLPPNIKSANFFDNSIKRLKTFGFNYFFHLTLLYLFNLILSNIPKFLRGRKFYSVKNVCENYGVKQISFSKINSKQSIKFLRNISPELIVSISAPQKFGEEILNLPKYGCLNVHGSLIPDFRGLQPSFWVLLKDEKYTGSTLHYMNEEIDGGKIIYQHKFKINENDTQFSIIKKNKALAALLILKAISSIMNSGKIVSFDNETDKGSYFSFPSKSDVSLFLERGKRFF